jgi:integrase
LGSRSRDVDLQAGTLTVNHALQRIGGKTNLVEPKTARSRRTVVLPEPCLDELISHQRKQREERRIAGYRWVEHNLVFTTTIGTPIDASNLRKEFAGHLVSARLPRIRFHDLRHTAASIQVAEGVHPRAVMEVFGHSQIGITMNLYSLVMDSTMRDAADRVGAALRPKKKAS